MDTILTVPGVFRRTGTHLAKIGVLPNWDAIVAPRSGGDVLRARGDADVRMSGEHRSCLLGSLTEIVYCLIGTTPSPRDSTRSASFISMHLKVVFFNLGRHRLTE